MKPSLCLLLLLPALLAAQVNTLTEKEAADGWLLLFDGETLFGWTQEGGAKWSARDGAIVTEPAESGWLRSNSRFADFVLKCEFKTAADGNSGIFLRSASEGQAHVTGYELQIWDQHPKFPTGSLVNHVAGEKTSLKPDQWNSYEIEVTGDRYLVRLNGRKVLDVRESKTKAGHLGLQYNKDKPIAFRNIKLKPLGLKPMFDGKSLSGWKVVDSPRPAKAPPEWSARSGMIHVEKGPGQLESESTYGDFLLQLDVRTNTKSASLHPNSGVFFRGDPAGYWTGYESQIRNEYKDADRKQPVDFGTGGLYFRQPARKVVGNDNEFFTKTINADGRHIAIWVNGYQAADFEDTRAEGKNAREQARLEAGTISLQAHDPTTNLDFRNIRIAEFPN